MKWYNAIGSKNDISYYDYIVRCGSACWWESEDCACQWSDNEEFLTRTTYTYVNIYTYMYKGRDYY